MLHKSNNHNNNNEKQDFALSTRTVRTVKCKTKKKLYHFPSRWTQRKKEIKQPTEKKIKIKKPRMKQYDLYRCLDCIT